ncbi:acyl-CoA N-acyltransferase [Nemania sp. NC0429]|nr:acyl-CoA N-acyltransferase [Nemania sp. NC0429]
MKLEVQNIDPEVDFPAIARCLFESYEDPPQNFFHISFPINGTSNEAREEAIKEAAERLKQWHTDDPTSHWQKVVDADTGKVAGGALWNVYEENPFANPHQVPVTWFPEGGSRTFAERTLEDHVRPRSEAAQRPHIYLFIIFTHPDYRRTGVGRQLMSWGLEKSKQLDVDIFLDSTPYGRPLYEATGFEYIEENVTIPKTQIEDDSWKEIEKKVGPFTFWLMRRPARG